MPLSSCEVDRHLFLATAATHDNSGWMITYLPDLPLLAAYVASVIVLNLTPGPDMTFFIGRALGQGRAAGLAALYGAVAGVFIHTLLVVFGLSALIAASPQLYNVLRLAGAAYLLWLAWQAIRYGSAFKVKAERGAPQSVLSNWLQGIAINLLNPKIVVFFVTFLPQFVAAGDPQASGKLLMLGVLFCVVSAIVLTPMVLAAASFANWMQSRPRVTRAMDWLFGSLLAAFAIRLLVSEQGR